MNDMLNRINPSYLSKMKDDISPLYNAINRNRYLCFSNSCLMQLCLERMVRVSINEMYLIFRTLT
ncbi:hypothetical protein ANRL3_00391 [Anaerolineae bacterium]|nr:hypothetical protein ANRL3_00391 [Anaerolineae bacterium]